VRASLLDTLDDFERWGKHRGKHNDHACAYVFPLGYRHERWSYQRVADVAYQFARLLVERGIVKGDAVLLWTPNCAEWVASFLGCALCGVIAVPIDDAASPDFARRVAVQVPTRLILCPRERAAIFEERATALEKRASALEKENVSVPKLLIIDPVDLARTLAEFSPQPFRPAQIQPSDPLEIVFTSGTTAEPKGVVLTHANVAGNVRPIEAEMQKYLKYERLVHPIRFLNLLPLSHVFGQFLGIFLPPLLGGTVVFEDTFNPAEIIATIRRERVSVLVAVPRMIESLKQKIERDFDLSGKRENFTARYASAKNQHFLRRWWTFRDVRCRFGWKFWAIISGGAALDRDTEEFWHRLGYAMIQGYGLTETTSLISLNHPFHTSRGSIGKVLPGREIKLAEDGEILVRGSGVASGYWNGRELQPVATPEDDGWYRTGDLGALDEQGNLFFKGRKKEVMVTPAGMNVYPEDLEAALRQQPEVRDCVVVGLERGGNADPCAVLILRARDEDDSRTLESGNVEWAGAESADVKLNAAKSTNAKANAAARQIVQRANETLAEYQRMNDWFVWPEEDFPRSATQKPRRNVIRDAVEAALAGQSATAADSTRPLAELLTRITGRVPQNLTPATNLESGPGLSSLGLSSLDRVELLSALEDRFQVDLSETKFAAAATVGDLEKLLQPEPVWSGRTRPLPSATPVPRSFHYPRWTLRWPTTWLRLAAHYFLVRPAMFLLGWPRILGRENLRGIRGPLLVVSNHIDDVDVGFIQAALPPRIRYKLVTATGGEALEKLRSPAPDRAWFKRIYGRVQWALGVALLNLFPLPREAGFRKSFAYAGAAVDRGYSVLVFPEGRHTEDGKLRPFRNGVGLLANNLRIPVLPMRIDGLFEVKQAGKKFAAPGKIQVRIGKPMQFATETNPRQIAQALQQAVERL
jgi:long-chain acyl-CoA synthetase